MLARGGRSIEVTRRVDRRRSGSGESSADGGIHGLRPDGRSPQSSTRAEIGSVEPMGRGGAGEHAPPRQGVRGRGAWGSPGSGAAPPGAGSRIARSATRRDGAVRATQGWSQPAYASVGEDAIETVSISPAT